MTLVCLAALATAALTGLRRGAQATGAPGRRGRELLGEHRRAARRATGPRSRASSPTPPSTRTATSRRRRTPARLAVADVAIVNGIGYDRWASQLLAANPSRGRVVVDAGDVLGLGDGDNPHQWYSPSSVRRVADAIAAALRQGRSRGRPVLRRAGSARSSRSCSPATTRSAPRSAAAMPGVARRLQREHLRAARCEPRPEAPDARRASPRPSPRAAR